jgi:ATP-dependent DNA helicase RecG
MKRAYVRIGNESVPAPDYILNELILKGSNHTYDTVATDKRKKDYSFTLLEATYFQRVRLRFEASDYISFGLADEDGILTRAGTLLTDQHIVYNSRLFCTRWNGLSKGSIFDDALDDKEYEGNLIYLLNSGCDFVKNNTKVRFAKEATERIDKPDYAERAVTEALVNALIHRDYLMMGSEIHIDLYDDRLEITSPGGMYSGKIVQEQDIETIQSERRNPVIADLFHRVRYMERRGSGLKKIVAETKKLPGYTEAFQPEFFSTISSFTVKMKNVNYGVEKQSEFGEVFGDEFGEKQTHEKIITIMRSNPSVSAKAIGEQIGMTTRGVEKCIRSMKKSGLIEHVGSARSGHWVVRQSE